MATKTKSRPTSRSSRSKAPQPGMTPAQPERPEDVRVARTAVGGGAEEPEERGGPFHRLRRWFTPAN